MFDFFKVFKENSLIFLVLFIFLCLISVPNVIFSNERSYEQTRVDVLASYVHSFDYDYSANLVPNEIYQNVSVLKPGDGLVYESVVESIDVFLSYSFDVDVPVDFSVNYYFVELLVTDSWGFELNRSESQRVFDETFEVVLPVLDKEWIEAKKNELEDETGSYFPYYSVVYSPVFDVSFVSEFGRVEESFNPELEVALMRSDGGRIYSILNLTRQESGEVVDERIVWNLDVMAQQFLSFVLLVFSSCGLVIAFVVYYRQPKEVGDGFVLSRKKWDKLRKSNSDLFFEAEKSVSVDDKNYCVVAFASLEELIRFSEVVDKPIMFLGDFESREFYVIDKDTKYLFKNGVAEKE